MTKMRDNMPVILIGLVVVFLITIIFDWGMGYLGLDTGRQNPVIGEINGKEITYLEFNQLVERARENQKAQSGQDIEDDQFETFRQQVWDAYVTQILIEQQIDKWGIKVTDDEIRDIILGEEPPEFLKRNFIDSLGNFNRSIYEQALMDPRNREALVQAEDAVKQQQLQEKLQSFIQASIIIPENDIKRKFQEQTLSADAKFVLFDPNSIPDDQAKVTDEDLKNYYNKNLDLYKIEAQRKLKHVMFREAATKSDSESVFKSLKSIAEEAKKDTDFASIVKIYSTKPYQEKAVTHGSLPKDGEKILYSGKVGEVVGPVPTYEGYSVYKIVKDSSSQDEYVQASHILINFGADTSLAQKKINELLSGLRGGADFAKVAKDYSQDQMSAVQGGDLGWFGKGMMVPEFEKAAFNAKIGDLVGPIKTNYGFHIIKVSNRSRRVIIAAEINIPVKVSAQTREEIYNSANDLVYIVNKGSDFEKEAELMKYPIQETTPFNEKSEFVPGIGMHKAIVQFAFDNKLGTVSDVFRISNGYVVVKISEVIHAGVKRFDEVKEGLKPTVLREKKMDMMKKKADGMRNKIPSGEGLEFLTSIDQNLVTTQTGSFNYGQSVGGGVGRDFSFNYTAFNMKQNQISQPIKGSRGYYLIQLISKSSFDSTAYSIQKNILRTQIFQEKRSQMFNNWLSELKKNSKIEDYRYKYYR
ncbi:MAG: peptidylprolyl isomerase [Bacteroidetes bacterium]|nr:peptidylprolyl isomerase [Bacteroidota bacterium]